MTVELSDKDWLAGLLEAELAGYDPAETQARLPEELIQLAAGLDLAPGARMLVARSLRLRRLQSAPASPVDTFLHEVRDHVGLVLDLSLLVGVPWQPARARVEVAACLAGALGEHGLALAVHAGREDAGVAHQVGAALRAAGRALQARAFPPGDPVDGLPLYPGARAILRRHLARVASGLHRTGRLDAVSLDRHRAYAWQEGTLLAEGLASLLGSALPAPSDSVRVLRRRQLARLGLSGGPLRAARRAVAAPRSAGALALATPTRIRPFLLEQALLAQLRAHLKPEAVLAWVDAFREAARLDAQALVAAQIEAAAQQDDHFAWFEAVGGDEWQALATAWEDAADDVVERVSDAVTSNFDALTTEIRKTGELGQLLARAAAGATLSAEEKRKVKAQLLDLAKAVPALAIFAAPGGMLLLPLLAKLLPFNLLPSAWDRPASSSRGGKVPASEPP
jgi:hypothetical protein